MNTVIQIIDGHVLGQVISLPKALQETKVRITVVPVAPLVPAEQDKAPKLTRAMLKEKLKGSIVEEISGALKDAGDIDLKEIAFDTSSMEWEKEWSEYNQNYIFNKRFIDDEDTGMKIKQMIYPMGFNTRWHTHPCSHGIYVLRGKLKTNKGLYGPGSFVWFPEGVLAEHGSTPEEDVEVLFITNKAFEINFQDNGGL